MNKPITPGQMDQWVKETWQRCLDEAWERTKQKLEQPETLAVIKRMKDK